MPLDVKEINKIDEFFLFFRGIDWTSPEKSKTIRNLPKNLQFLGLIRFIKDFHSDCKLHAYLLHVGILQDPKELFKCDQAILKHDYH